MTTAGLLIGFFLILFLPLHRMRLFGSLTALSFLIFGADFEAVSKLEIPDRGLPDSRLTLVGGAMMGASVGYFAGWIRSAWRSGGARQSTTALDPKPEGNDNPELESEGAPSGGEDALCATDVG